MKGKETVVLDLREATPLVDFFVITTASSSRQMKSLASEVSRKLKQAGSPRLSLEGEESTQWLLIDFGDVVVHVFSPTARGVYDLENLWADAQPVEWQASEGTK